MSNRNGSQETLIRRGTTTRDLRTQPDGTYTRTCPVLGCGCLTKVERAGEVVAGCRHLVRTWRVTIGHRRRAEYDVAGHRTWPAPAGGGHPAAA